MRDPLAEADDPFAQRRVYDEVAGVVRGVPLHAMLEQVVAFGGVVDLVEDLVLRRGGLRMREADQPYDAGNRSDQDGHDPREQPVVR